MPLQLEKSWLTGKVAAKIRWNTPGDYTRAYKQALKYGMSPPVGHGLANKLHKKATGVYPGDKRNIGKKSRFKKLKTKAKRTVRKTKRKVMVRRRKR